MRKFFGFIVMLFIMCVCFVHDSEASTLAFQNFTALNGVTVSVPYKANAGTERDPDTVTLLVDLSAPTLEFQLTAVGSGFTRGTWCELDWDDHSLGAPREHNVPLSGGGFNTAQNFSLSTSRLNLTAGNTRNVTYELEVDEEPYGAQGDVERHLRITFTTSGSSNPPTNPGGSRTLSFQNFTALNGATVSVPYKANSGTERDPDTVTLFVDLSAPTLEFQLTAVGSGFTRGTWCELDWDDHSLGSPREHNVPLSGGGFNTVQNFSLNTSRLNLTAGNTRNITYELEVDEEPYGAQGDVERHIRITFATTSNPTNPGGSGSGSGTTNSGDDGGGGGCNVTMSGLTALCGLFFLQRRLR